MIGETIGNFRIVSRIGRGGMGEVFLAEQSNIGTTVAIKVMLPEISRDHEQVQRFFNEARAVSKIRHAGTVKIFDVGFHKGQAYLIMEYLEGESLGDRLERLKRLPLPNLVDVGRQIASVLDATHAVGIIHRDLKPDNIYLVVDQELDGRERVKILDFGIAKLTDLSNGPRTVGTMGTPTYMAPEQWGDSATVDWRADLYSLGCVLFEMACGRPPFDGNTIPELYAQHLTSTAPSVRTFAPELPPALDTLLGHMLAKKPTERPDSMRAVMRQFDTLTWSTPFASTIQNVPAAASGPMQKSDESRPNTTLSNATSQLVGPAPRRTPVIPIVLAVAIVGVIVSIAVVVKQRHDRRAAAAADVRTPEPAATPVDASVTVDAAPETLATWFATANPFVTRNGISTTSHQITRAELRRYLEFLPAATRATARPLYRWDDTAGDQAVAWMSQDRAAAFCAAIGAKLPTKAQWKTLAGSQWGIDATGSGKLGPLQEWTSSVDGGLAEVAGGADSMLPEKQKAFVENGLQKSTEANAGSGAQIGTIASATIGFRCVR